MDTRLAVYRTNARRIPSVTGRVIPESVFTRADYEQLLAGIYRDLAPHDPKGVLQHEWINARGCIARFDRMALEIRLLDVQECPRMDLAIAVAVVATVQALVQERWTSVDEQKKWNEQDLERVLLSTIANADEAIIEDERFLRSFGLNDRGPLRAADLWAHLIETEVASRPEHEPVLPSLQTVLDRGCLARRLIRAAGPDTTPSRLETVYRRLADCLARGDSFAGQP
jgi:hypothetical protein